MNSYVDSLFHQICTKPGNQAIDTFDGHLTKTAALLWMPVPYGKLYEVDPHPKGSVVSNFTCFQPETWYFAK